MVTVTTSWLIVSTQPDRIKVVFKSEVITGNATATAELPIENVSNPRQHRKKTKILRMGE